MDLRFQPTIELRQSLMAIKAISNNGIFNVGTSGVKIIAQDDICSGNIILPKDYFMDFHVAPDTFSFNIDNFYNFVSSNTIHNMKDFAMDLTNFIEKPEKMYDTSIRLEITELISQIKGDSEFYVKEIFRINNQRVNTAKIDNPGSFFNKKEVRAHYNGEYLRKIISHMSRYCTLKFSTDSPLTLDYEIMGMRLYFVLAPMIAAK